MDKVQKLNSNEKGSFSMEYQIEDGRRSEGVR
jgi:hypothetical protein